MGTKRVTKVGPKNVIFEKQLAVKSVATLERELRFYSSSGCQKCDVFWTRSCTPREGTKQKVLVKFVPLPSEILVFGHFDTSVVVLKG